MVGEFNRETNHEAAGKGGVVVVEVARATTHPYLPVTLSFSFCLIGKRMRLEGMNTRH